MVIAASTQMRMDAQKVGAILLAAGQSSRFGAADKLRAPFRGWPLVRHAAETLSSIDIGCRIVVCTQALPVHWGDLGFQELRLAERGEMSTSIASGIRHLYDTKCTACLIALADMPFIPASHYMALIERMSSPVIATRLGSNRMVPALFAREKWVELASLSGDRGAQALLKNCPAIELSPAYLADIDTVADLARLD